MTAQRALRVSTGYEPRIHQRLIHERIKRFNVVVCHRRFGKTVMFVNQLIDAALRCKKPDGRFGYLAPYYSQAKDIAWVYLQRYALPVPGTGINETELRVDFPNGARVRLYGADNYDRLRGIYLDGVVLDEYADIDPRAWPEVILPTLTDRQGWAAFSGTPKGRNHFCDIYEKAADDPAWYAGIFKASETGVIPTGELDNARKSMLHEQYLQEFECSFQAAIVGAYYGEGISQAETEKRICSVPYDPGVKVDTSWDLGWDDATAIWCVQRVGREQHFIDYIEGSNVGLNWYVNELNRRGYTYGEHILPHDAEVHELGSGKSRIETLKSLGLGNIRTIPAHEINDYINAGRRLMPAAWFDKEKTKRGVECLRQFRRQWDDKRSAFAETPYRNWATHGAFAYGHYAMGLRTSASSWEKPIKYKHKSGLL